MPKSGTLTKARIVESVVETNGYTHKKFFETVEIILELIKRSLENGEDVLISGFGKFCVKKKKKRRGRNPATGEDMMRSSRSLRRLLKKNDIELIEEKTSQAITTYNSLLHQEKEVSAGFHVSC